MTEQTTIAVTATDFIRYCAHLAKAQGYMLPNIAEALKEVHRETLLVNWLSEELGLSPNGTLTRT